MVIDIKKFDKLKASQWEEKIFHRGVNHKFPQQLKYLIDEMYPVKIARLIEMLKEGRLDEEMADFLNAKILRLTDKYATCKKMYDLRQAKSVPTTKEWAMHGTIYYIDLDAGNDGNTGLSIAQAWLTLEQYTTTTVRTAGDIALVRANTTETVGANDIVFDEDGTVNSYISIIGCDSVTNDPWGDSSDVRPIIDFGDQIKNMVFSSDNYWKLERLDIIQSADTAGNLYIYNSYGVYVLNCIVRDNSAASLQAGLRVTYGRNCIVENCTFQDNISKNIYTSNSELKIINCTFNGGATTTDYGLWVGFGFAFIINSSFGQTTSHDIQDLFIETCGGVMYGRNNIYDKATLYVPTNSLGSITSEDHNQVKGANKVFYGFGIVTKDTGVVRSGGASSSAKLEPNSNCGLYAPLSVTPFNEYDFKIYCDAIATTVTVYIRSLGVWSAYPTNTQLYIEASYLDHGSDATRSIVVSTVVLADETTWVAFPITFTPLQAGLVYLKVYLKKYESSKGCYIDVLPVVS